MLFVFRCRFYSLDQLSEDLYQEGYRLCGGVWGIRDALENAEARM
jgi:hypothetical protein